MFREPQSCKSTSQAQSATEQSLDHGPKQPLLWGTLTFSANPLLQNRKGKKKEHTAVSKAGQQQWRVQHITPCACQCGADNQMSIHDAVIDTRPVDRLGGMHASAEGGGGVRVGTVEVSRWKEEAEGGSDEGESILQNE
ncbi:hypothetical protein CPB84DRAFT_1753168 [Gymnopilus junonius]|uniref:Uncharacterized protein n=1 Tax=Gymnopilus junonius TaxID=109634 RepID=A0A9P5N821_GYMJU|nr:hypothetical protein CPB84DRAFT_1753168 [Gymnopilus junonius]